VNQSGPARREGFLDAGGIAALLRDPDGFDPALVRDLHPGALRTRLIELGPGDIPPELLSRDVATGFVLDLDPPDWRSEWGGLLLLRGDGDRLHGYRPVPGALTLITAAERPLISLVAPHGGRRISILGWWN
jgi:hypothetical protein